MSMKRTTKEGRGNTKLSNNAQLKVQNTRIAHLEKKLHNAHIMMAEQEEILQFIDFCHEIEMQENFLEDVSILSVEEIEKLEPENEEEE
jgi:hypothetical protein